MAKTKKSSTVQSDDNVDGVNGGSNSENNGTQHRMKHAKNFNVRDMVTAAMKATGGESNNGAAWPTITTYIKKNYNTNRKLSKHVLEQIKSYIKAEFEKGTIVSRNTKGKTIRNIATMRFMVADEK